MTLGRIQVRLWLSSGIFGLGFLVSIVMSQVEQGIAERSLASLAGTTFPAAQRAHDADAAFKRVVETYSHAFLTQDRLELDLAAAETSPVTESLKGIANAPGASPEYALRARRILEALQEFLPEAAAAYRESLRGREQLTPALQERIRLLAVTTAKLKVDLQSLQVELAREVQNRMAGLQAQSARIRVFTLTVFCGTLALAAFLVNLTVRRSILAPLSKTQTALSRERDLLRALMDNIPDCIYFKDGESRFVRVNKAQATLLGVNDPAEALGHSDLDYFDREVAQKTYEDEQRILQTGEPLVASIERITRKGLVRWVTANKVRVRAEMGDPEMGDGQLIVGISTDITNWMETVEALERSEASFRLLFSAIPNAVWVCDADTLEILQVNDAAIRCYGYSAKEFRGMRINEIYPDSDPERLTRALFSSRPANSPKAHQKHLTKDGSVLEVEIAVHMLHLHGRRAVLIMAQDLTERKRLELELQHSQRLEAVGHLAAGIAHEINTPIQFVGDNLRFLHDAFIDRQALMAKYRQLYQAALAGEIPRPLLNALADDVDSADMEYLAAEIPRALDQALDGVGRVATIVGAMKAFAHPGTRDKAAADLNKALADTLIVARNEVKYVADTVTDFGDLPPVICHLAGLNQVFLNLLINAAHAIGEVVQKTGGRGQICVRTRREGEQVVISISDTGCGVPESIKSRIFDPFFTTKEVGRGTGQGLALARSIVVDKHGGRITFEPNPPQGTTFVVSLPIESRHAEVLEPLPHAVEESHEEHIVC